MVQAASNRAALLEATEGVAPFDLVVAQRFDEARALLGAGRAARTVRNKRHRIQPWTRVTDAR